MCEVVLKSLTGEKLKNRKQLKKFMDAKNDKVYNLLQSGANLDAMSDKHRSSEDQRFRMLNVRLHGTKKYYFE